MGRRNQNLSKLKTSIERISQQVEDHNKEEKKAPPGVYLSSGCTEFNLACSDKPNGAFSLGRMFNLIGDSHSGKTLMCLTMLAEACKNPFFDNYRLIYDDVENANEFDVGYLFGKVAEGRIEPPAINEDGDSKFSDTIEDFHFYIRDLLDQETPFIYILDSFDALIAQQDRDKIEEMMNARRKGKETSGSYRMAKPKKASEILSDICNPLKKTKSILGVVSQTRDNIDPTSFQRQTRSGGRALKFYAHHEIWLAPFQPIKSKDKDIGNYVKAKISKNKVTGKRRIITFPIYNDYGIDDIRGCVQFLLREGVWKKNKQSIDAHHFGILSSEDKLVREIENRGLESKLSKIVGRKWTEIEDSLKLNRKPRYR